MLVLFKLTNDNYEDNNKIAKMLFDTVNNNPTRELKDRETARRIRVFDKELKKIMVHVEEKPCLSCGRPMINNWNLKPEGGAFVVDQLVAKTIREIFEDLFPHLTVINAERGLLTYDFLELCQPIKEDDWNASNT